MKNEFTYTNGSLSRLIVSRIMEEPTIKETTITNSLDCHKFWKNHVASKDDYEGDKENLIVVLLNTMHVPFAWHRIGMGSLNECTAHPREILRPVIVGSAYGFVLMHNHPSGDTTPSNADTALTRRLNEAANLMMLAFVDHVIVADGGREFSFKETGLL